MGLLVSSNGIGDQRRSHVPNYSSFKLESSDKKWFYQNDISDVGVIDLTHIIERSHNFDFINIIG
jgi:hypothetical protein